MNIFINKIEISDIFNAIKIEVSNGSVKIYNNDCDSWRGVDGYECFNSETSGLIFTSCADDSHETLIDGKLLYGAAESYALYKALLIASNFNKNLAKQLT